MTLSAGVVPRWAKGLFAISNALKDVPTAKVALKHFTSFEIVVWCNILRDTLTELALAELVGQKSDSTFGNVDQMWCHARRVATDVKEKRYCRTIVQDMGTVLGRLVCNNVQLHGTPEAAGKAMNDAIVASAAKWSVKYSLYMHLKFLNLATWPSPGSKVMSCM